VVDHHTGRLVWAHAGRDRKTVEKFLDTLGTERGEQIELVSCDDAEWITRLIADRCPNAVICLDPFHIVQAATDALDEIRRELWNEARKAGNKQLAHPARVRCRPGRNERPRRTAHPSMAWDSRGTPRCRGKRVISGVVGRG